MTYEELNDTIYRLNEKAEYLRNLYEDNGGEETTETIIEERIYDELRELLNTEGVDMLGRWLKSKQDERQSLKDEKGFLDRKIKNLDRTIDFIEGRIYYLMEATGTDKVKGTHGYSFSKRESRTVSVDTSALNDRYLERVTDAVKDILPADVSVSLKASVSSWRTFNGDAAELPAYYVETVKPSVTFTKPRRTTDDGAES